MCIRDSNSLARYFVFPIGSSWCGLFYAGQCESQRSEDHSMKQYDCIFLDRDGTLNSDPGYINSLDDFIFFDNTLPSLKKMAGAGNRFCIVTNQSGINRGLIQFDDLDEIHSFIEQEFKKNGIPLLGIYVCTDHPEQATERRKPGPGMFLEDEMDNGLILNDS